MGAVTKLRHLISHELFVSKAMHLSAAVEQEKVHRMIDGLTRLEHPCIVSVIGCFPIRDQRLVVLSAFVGGATLKEILDSRPFPEWWTPTAVTKILVGIVVGMKYAHAKQIVHGDLRPSSVIVDQLRNPHLVDFAFRKLGVVCTRPTEATMYADPNPDHEDEEAADRAADVYSFGVVMYEVMVAGQASPDVLRRIALNKLLQGKRPAIPRDMGKAARDLIEWCWAESAATRPTFEQVYRILRARDFRLYDDVDVNAVELYIDSVSSDLMGIGPD